MINPKSLANLKPQRAGEPGRNLNGVNGYTKRSLKTIELFRELGEDEATSKDHSGSIVHSGLSWDVAIVSKLRVLAVSGEQWAMELWMAYRHGKPTVTVSGVDNNGNQAPLFPESRKTTVQLINEVVQLYPTDVVAAIKGTGDENT